MKDKDDLIEDKEVDEEFKTYYEDEETRKRFPGFLLLFLITTVGVMFALGLSFSAIKLMDSNETINTLISSLTGDDNKDKYIITYIENTGNDGENFETSTDGRLYISSASFYKSTNDGSGEVTYYGGMMVTTKTTFKNQSSTVTYKIIITNSSSTSKTFNELIYNQDGDVKYTLSGINKGDIIGPGKNVTAYLTVEYTGKDTSDYPKTIESSSQFSYDKKDGILHIIDANVYKTTNDGTGEIVYYGGMMVTTKTTFNEKSSTVTYKITIKNDSTEAKTYNGINYNTDSGVKYTLSGIKDGDKFTAGESKIVYLTVEYNGKDDTPKTIESSLAFDFTDFGVSTGENGIYLINQFPTRDEVGKLFRGKNYVFTFSLLLGKKTEGSYYELTAVPEQGNTLNPNYVKIYLEKNQKGVDMSYRTNGRVKVFTEYNFSENPGTEGRVIYKDYVTSDDVKRGRIDFVMRMWVTEDLEITDDNSADYFNKKFVARVNTYALYPNNK